MAGRRTWQSAAATDGEGERVEEVDGKWRCGEWRRGGVKSGRQVMKLPLL